MSFSSIERKSLTSSCDDFVLIPRNQENITPNGRITDVAQKQLTNGSIQNVEVKRVVHEMSEQEEGKLANVFDGLFEQKELRPQYATIFNRLPRNQRLRSQKVKHLKGIRTAEDPVAYVNKHFTSEAAQHILTVSKEKKGDLRQGIYDTLWNLQIDTIKIDALLNKKIKLEPKDEKMMAQQEESLAKVASGFEERDELQPRYEKVFKVVPTTELIRMQKVKHLKGIRTAQDPVAYVKRNFKADAAHYILTVSQNKKGNLRQNIWETLLGLPIEMTNIEVLFDQYPTNQKLEKQKIEAASMKNQAYSLVFKQEVSGTVDEGQIKSRLIEEISKLDGTKLEEQIDSIFDVFPARYVHDQARRIFYRSENSLSLTECYVQAIQELPISNLKSLEKLLLPYQTYEVELLKSPYEPVPVMIEPRKQMVEKVVVTSKIEQNKANPLLDNLEKVATGVKGFLNNNQQLSTVKGKLTELASKLESQIH